MSVIEVLILGLGSGVAVTLLVAITRRTKDFLNAAVLFSLSWMVNIVSCMLLPYEELRLQPATLAVVVTAWWAVLAGFLGGCSFRWRGSQRPVSVSPNCGVLLLVTLIGLQLVSLALETHQTGLFSSGGSILEGLADLPRMRLSGAGAEEEFRGFWALWRWNFTLYLPLAFLLFRARVLKLQWLGLVVVIAMISAVLRFTRAPVLNVITICIVGMWAVRSQATSKWWVARHRLAAALVIIAGFLLLFGGMQAVLTSEMGLRGGRLTDALLSYVGGPLRAFEDVLHNSEWAQDDRLYSLDFADFFAFKLGLKQNYDGLIRPIIDVGVVTNLYTYLDAFTADAGIPGALMGSLALGFFAGWLFERVRRRPTYWNLVVYSYAAYAFLMAGANNEFIRFNFFLTAALAGVFSIALSAESRSRAPRPAC